jgi:hypothetical protein
MSSEKKLWRRVMAPSAVLACAAALLTGSAVAQAPPIRFAVEVPAAPAQMQLFRLQTSAAPLEFLNEKLAAAKLPALRPELGVLVGRGATGATDLDRVRVYADPKTGDAHLIPNLAELVGPSATRQALPLERLQGLARQAFADPRFIPKDGTELRVGEAIPIMGGATTRAPATNAAPVVEPRLVMAITPAQRFAAGLPVYGRGSHATVSVAADGAIVGALRRWRPATAADRVDTRTSPEQVRAEVERQLKPYVAAPGARAVVDRMEVAYYDGGRELLNPVIRFEATLTSGNERVGPAKIAGFVPLAKAHEPIPDLAAAPTTHPPGSSKPVGAKGDAAIVNDISLGEFVNQDWPTSSAYLDMANSFLSGLQTGSQPVSRTIWWTAYAWQVVSPQSKNWMNAVNVAYTEPHGDWLYNTTKSNCCDSWYVPNIGTGGNPGFGHAAGGVMATWVIMSCEVIPSYYDRQHEIGGSGNGSKAFDAWWPVFQGLHNAIGFRTIMFYPDDSLNYGFGQDAAHGGDVNAAWFDEVAANDGDDGTYPSQHLNGHPSVHYDRASTMIDSRDLGHSIFAVGAQSASTTLWNFWMGN